MKYIPKYRVNDSIDRSKNNIVGIIQARMSSKRLPNKMMLRLHGIPIIQWVLERSKKSKLLDKLVIAIPDTKDNDVLNGFLNEFDVNIYRGCENNLVDRYYKAALLYDATDIVRICADRPFISPDEIDNLIKYFLNGYYDYAYNHIPINNQYPTGFGAEISTVGVLKKIYEEASDPSDLEHLFNYILKLERSTIKVGTFNPIDKNLRRPELKFDIDTIDDYNNLCSVDYSIDLTPRQIIYKRDQYANNKRSLG